MEEFLKTKEKANSGITLIALVITIIVLLILAGVSIAMLTGQNGILTQAQNSKQATEKAEVKERAQTDIVGVQTETESTEISKTALKRILDKYFDNVPNDIKSDTEITAKAEYGGAKMKVSDIYSGEIIERYMAADIANATQEEKQSIYGATVTGYTLPSGTTTDVGWKIFYADNSNIYLIADNYVERNNLPNSTTESGVVTANKPNDGDSNNSMARSANIKNILGDYSGSSRITDSRLKLLNNDYFSKNYSSTGENMKAVAYMMDTKAWNSKFLDSNKADYCIGGPSVELLFKSYNEKYKTAFESQASSANGYQIRKTSPSDSWANNVYSMLSTSDPLYVIPLAFDAYAYWVASPSANGTNAVMLVNYNGDVNINYYGINGNGFRPLVCLKSNIKLQKVSNTQYAIQ